MKRYWIIILSFVLVFGFTACDSGDTETVYKPVPTYSIQGTITLGAVGLAHVSVELTGINGTLAQNSAITDASGNFTFKNCPNGFYQITPLPSGYTFDADGDEYLEVAVADADVTGQDFTATKNEGANVFLHYTLPDQMHFLSNYPGATYDDEADLLFSTYTLSDDVLYVDEPAQYVSGYALDQFINQDAVAAVTPNPDDKLAGIDARALYSYVANSNLDGFDNRTKLNDLGKLSYAPDARWDQFNQGYLLDLAYSAKVFFPTAAGLTKMYNNKFAYDVFMFRKIDVKRPDTDGTLASFEISATTDSYYDHTVFTTETGRDMTKFTVEEISFYSNSLTDTAARAIRVEQFITPFVVEDPANVNLTYSIVADDFSRTGWTWDQIRYNDGSESDQIAYYLVDYDYIARVQWSIANSRYEQVSSTKVNYPVRIEIVTADSTTISDADDYYENDVDLQDPPAFAVYE